MGAYWRYAHFPRRVPEYLSGDSLLEGTGSGALGALPLRLSGMLGILPRLWKIRVRIFEHRVLIAVSQLFLHADIPRHFVIFGLCGAFRRVLILCIVRHNCTSCE